MPIRAELCANGGPATNPVSEYKTNNSTALQGPLDVSPKPEL
ncbi:hypothetical protein [Hyphomicrobium sp. 2TAF46]